MFSLGSWTWPVIIVVLLCAVLIMVILPVPAACGNGRVNPVGELSCES